MRLIGPKMRVMRPQMRLIRRKMWLLKSKMRLLKSKMRLICTKNEVNQGKNEVSLHQNRGILHQKIAYIKNFSYLCAVSPRQASLWRSNVRGFFIPIPTSHPPSPHLVHSSEAVAEAPSKASTLCWGRKPEFPEYFLIDKAQTLQFHIIFAK